MSEAVALAAQERVERLAFAEFDARIDLLLAHGADHFEKVTADPRKMGYLRFLLRYYSKFPHIWTKCMSDNVKRFGPNGAKGVCSVIKDTIRQNPRWRHGAPRGPHPGHPDAGAPGVAIGEADKWAAPAWGGHHLSEGRPLSLLDELDMEFGVVDHEENIIAAAEVLCAIGKYCDVYRVLIGLDEPPTFEEDE